MKWADRPAQFRFRVIGVLVLLLGAITAAVVGWRGAHSATLVDDPAMARYYQQEARQAEILYGSLGVTANDLWKGLKRPRTQAILIAGVSVLVASGCFFFARLAGAGDAR